MVARPKQSDTAEVSPSHETALGDLPRPSWLKSTSLLDNTWLIGFDDVHLKRRSRRTLRFDTIVAPGSIRSTDPALRHDLLTAKLLIYHALKPGFMGGITTSTSYASILVREYFNFVRWRLSRGIACNADLTGDWIEVFFDQIRSDGPASLLPLEDRASALIARYQAVGRRLPTQHSWGRPTLALLPLAREIGLDHASALPQKVRAIFLEAAELEGMAPPRMRKDETGRTGKRGRNIAQWSASRLLPLLRPLELMHRFARHLKHDPISFDPFASSGSFWLSAKSLATRAPSRTPTVPPAQACHLINEALIWVLNYSDDIVVLAEKLQDELADVTTPSVRHKRSQRVLRDFKPNTSAFPWHLAESPMDARRMIIDLMPGACVVVIAAFAARRHEEIDSLRVGAIEESCGDYWLESWISKTVRANAKLPVPSSVARAIQVLERLGAQQRKRTGSRWLFDFGSPGLEERKRTSIRQALTEFEEVANVPSLPDGTRWWFTPHQFRRFFGIAYYHHYRYPNLAALSQFYRHFDPDMTRTYITEAAHGSFLRIEEDKAVTAEASRRERVREAARFADFTAEAKKFRLDRYHRILAGDERASGFGGEALTQELKRLEAQFRSEVEIGRPAEQKGSLDAALETLAQTTRLEPNQLGHSFCRCTSDPLALKAANCLQQSAAASDELRNAPDPRYAADEVCSPCPHNVQLPENEGYWRELEVHARDQAKCAVGTLLAAVAERRAEMASRHIERCFK